MNISDDTTPFLSISMKYDIKYVDNKGVFVIL